MQDDLPGELRAALAAARRVSEDKAHGTAARAGRLRLRVGRTSHPVLRLWQDGLSLPPEAGADLRGRVEVYDGARLLFHALVVASQDGGGEVVCHFKRVTPATDAAPRDYAEGRDPDLLPEA